MVDFDLGRAYWALRMVEELFGRGEIDWRGVPGNLSLLFALRCWRDVRVAPMPVPDTPVVGYMLRRRELRVLGRSGTYRAEMYYLYEISVDGLTAASCTYGDDPPYSLHPPRLEEYLRRVEPVGVAVIGSEARHPYGYLVLSRDARYRFLEAPSKPAGLDGWEGVVARWHDRIMYAVLPRGQAAQVKTWVEACWRAGPAADRGWVRREGAAEPLIRMLRDAGVAGIRPSEVWDISLEEWPEMVGGDLGDAGAYSLGSIAITLKTGYKIIANMTLKPVNPAKEPAVNITHRIQATD